MAKRILKAIYGSDKTAIKLGELEIPCYVLENGQRVLSRNGIQKALGYEGTSGDWLPSFVNNKILAPYFSAGVLEQLSSYTEFERPTASGSQSKTYGHDAPILIDICDAIIEAKNAGVLNARQLIYAAQAEIIIRSVAKVGIIALVDEATGYLKDKNRAKDEFQKFLNQFMRDEAAKLVKRFEDSFFEMIYRMRGWTWNYAHRHPGVVGIWINDIVYERIAPLVLTELRKKNPIRKKDPKNDKGTRDKRHHQFLSEELGVPKLLNHLAAVEALGRASGYNWVKFMEMLDIAFPKQHQQLSLLFDEDESLPENKGENLSSFNQSLKKALDYNPKKDESND